MNVGASTPSSPSGKVMPTAPLEKEARGGARNERSQRR